METKLAENIRAFRKERRMTQEQLAEALGVTVGAVSKWESGASTPDISLILELARFFETSVDVLLGYDWRGGGMGQTLERIKALRNAKRFDEATAEAEKALQKYPNLFDVTYQSAVLFCLQGVERHNEKSYRRALALLERSLELATQNTDPHINEWSIRNQIADVYVCLGQTQEALERLKQNNADGVNDGSIGCVLAGKEHQPDEALPYLSDALIHGVQELVRVGIGFVNAYSDRKEYATALDVLLWLLGVITGLQKPGERSYLDKEASQLLTACAEMAACLSDEADAREYLRRAVASAEYFDISPVYDFANCRFFHSNQKNVTAFDDFGSTAMEGIRGTISQNEETADTLNRLLEEL